MISACSVADFYTVTDVSDSDFLSSVSVPVRSLYVPSSLSASPVPLQDILSRV